ncbi:spore coat protein YlbD [Gracilibacillus sp. YIM 98692]|uniref:spore coat protein YlbD n=1 Tax=Gracilibacillus sp. YIM 98692 TaxID=2663532 RepID=UPI0013D4A042|nr:spore coat protein YlbD [Gracilibacillus sp. YIM 98692]
MHPNVQQFKGFLKEHPGLVKKIKANEVELQDIYEQFVLLGEDDPSWKKYKTIQSTDNNKTVPSENAKDVYSKIMKHMNQLDLNQVEAHVHDLNGAIDNILTLINQFKGYKNKVNANSSWSDIFTTQPKD